VSEGCPSRAVAPPVRAREDRAASPRSAPRGGCLETYAAGPVVDPGPVTRL